MSVKLSVITDEVSQDLNKVVKFAKEHELQGVEIRTLWNLKPQDLLEKAGEIRSTVSTAGLYVSAIASPVFKCRLDYEDEVKEHLYILKRCVALAKCLDTNVVRVFTFWRLGSFDDYKLEVKEKFMEAVDIAESEGVILAVENEPTTHVNNGRRLRQFIEEVGKPNAVKAVWDPGNDVFDPEGERPYPNGYSFIKDFIVHVHVKDGKRLNVGHEFVPVGEGDVGWLEQVVALLRDGYKGFFSLETHWRPLGLPTELIQMPGGEAYSEAGEYASSVCARNLKFIVRKAESLVSS
ncbi:MAG: sugar phosphate isomerase/epimerase [Thermofilaceae archaeon]|nr:sugar phosphate isomerase/epimerase [Thermofilaceae archaeon]MDW8003869.1 sugar phosphate isomerase/epimerase [Thermofilaceae archaeon]